MARPKGSKNKEKAIEAVEMVKTNPKPQTLSFYEAATHYTALLDVHISEQTIKMWVDHGKLKAVKTPGLPRITQASIDKWRP